MTDWDRRGNVYTAHHVDSVLRVVREDGAPLRKWVWRVYINDGYRGSASSAADARQMAVEFADKLQSSRVAS